MKLSGKYSLENLVRTLQGNFLCQSVTKDGRGKPIDESKQYVALELFFLRFEFYNKEVKVYKISEDENGTKKLTPLVTLEGK